MPKFDLNVGHFRPLKLCCRTCKPFVSGTVRYSTVQYGTVSPVQYGTVQYSTVMTDVSSECSAFVFRVKHFVAQRHVGTSAEYVN